jgi:hypothetical protein
MENAATKIKLPIAKRSNKGCAKHCKMMSVFLMGKTGDTAALCGKQRFLEEFGEERMDTRFLKLAS